MPATPECFGMYRRIFTRSLHEHRLERKPGSVNGALYNGATSFPQGSRSKKWPLCCLRPCHIQEHHPERSVSMEANYCKNDCGSTDYTEIYKPPQKHKFKVFCMQVRMHLAILLQPQLEPQGYMELRLHGSSKKSQVFTRPRDSSAKPSQVWLGSSDTSDIESPTLVDMSPKLVSLSHASNSASLSSSTSAQRFLDRLHGRSVVSMLSTGAQAEAPVHVDTSDKVWAASRS